MFAYFLRISYCFFVLLYRRNLWNISITCYKRQMMIQLNMQNIILLLKDQLCNI